MRYIPHTQHDIELMLKTIGVAKIDDLFKSIPEELRKKGALDLPQPLAENELKKQMESLAADTPAGKDMLAFQGAGIYPHFAPAVIDQLLLRQEFYTAYTPYQPEISQGTLQAIFEFQTLIADLYGMEVANASLYDGASALAEGVLMAKRVLKNKRTRLVLSSDIHPEYRQTIRTYLSALSDEIAEVKIGENGKPSDKDLLDAVDGNTYALALQYPNFFGQVSDFAALIDEVHKKGALVVVAVPEPLSLALLKPPGEMGADIVVGEGQSFGIPMSFGGPSLGLFAAKMDQVRQMPGRLVGETVDTEGNRGFVLTLSTREQHIRRERATSNICTNVGLNALSATIYMSLFGKSGLKELARQNAARLNYFIDKMKTISDITLKFSGPFFNEVPVRFKNKQAKDISDKLVGEGIIPGLPLGKLYPALADTMLICTTEVHSKEDINKLVNALSKAT